MSFILSTVRRSRSYKWGFLALERRTSTSTASPTKRPSPSRKLPEGPARTRFAPSPTGYLHLGSLRTALYNYLLAKSTGGQFLLRIEDTDQKRTIPDAEERLCQDLLWAGLQWDEGPQVGGPYGPYKQSQRTALYREHSEMLLRSGNAYRCFCSPERLLALARTRTELGLPTNYDRACIHLSTEEAQDRAAKGDAHVVRLKAPARYPEFRDLVYGLVRGRQENERRAIGIDNFEDPILLKSDGFPTYHLANVVDDHYMKITHVIRGAEWMSSTPKHLAMYNAFGWQPPAFAHVGLLMDQTRQKLSKRNLDLDISAFRDRMGIFPDALANFVALLGWSHDRRNDLLSLRELIDNFSLKFTTGDTVVTFDKLLFLQKAHARRYADIGNEGEISLMTKPIKAVLKTSKLDRSLDHILAGRSQEDYIRKLVSADARNYTSATAFVERNKFFFTTPMEADLISTRPHLRHSRVPKGVTNPVKAEEVAKAISYLDSVSVEQWNLESIKNAINMIISIKVEEDHRAINTETEDVQTEKMLGKAWASLIFGYVRWALTAQMHGPDAAASMDILGRAETLSRLSTAAKVLKQTETAAPPKDHLTES
ncbi:MAG: Glutamate--tRNA ligase mitochondrial [Claussenomyces sp. TS43310]|nr:MAG: Glutamate--tRNA ligase mitochondrial [Claussenomyces sp. TS43310]